jgi:branched-chain amino acid transport system permease protein
MAEIFGIPLPLLAGQLLVGLINGSFYAVLSLGLALIFGLLGVVNFAHGVLYTLGAFVAWWLLNTLGLNYWYALILAPLIVGLFGMLMERLLLRRIAGIDPVYGLLLTFGVALIVEGMLRHFYGVSGMSYAIPEALRGGQNLGFMFLPNYRGWAIAASLAVCIGTWLLIEKTSIGAKLRAATENASQVRAFGINVPLLITLTFGFGAALAGLSGVLAAPIFSVNPLMGVNLIIVVFAVVVIGGVGSIMGAVVAGFLVGFVEGLVRVFYPEGAGMAVFVLMILVLMFRPAGLFGKVAR